MLETLTTIIGALNNPLVQLGSAALFTLALALSGYAIKTQPKVHDLAQELADLSEEIEPWVVEFEAKILSGDQKRSQVLDHAQAWLKSQGITGQRGRLLKKHLPVLVELAVRAMKKKQADTPPAGGVAA